VSALGVVPARDVEERARQSEGTSAEAIYRLVDGALEGRHPGGGLLLDVGCGQGRLWGFVRRRFERYLGVDAVRYEGFPPDGQFVRAVLDGEPVPLPDESAEVVVAVETVEHLENPRACARELTRLVKPGGWVVITTPNQLSLLSLLTLVVKHRFSAFQDVHYPAHLTALLEVDLRRLASECSLADVHVDYTKQGRVVLTPWHYPRWLSRLFPRALSDNVLLVGRKPGAPRRA
jgi:2-polyprenyl-3-methyl-5-hydroxy-6-metoxy-1,4-benzoquinol methylase